MKTLCQDSIDETHILTRNREIMQNGMSVRMYMAQL